MTLSAQIKSKAKQLGFARCGITRAGPLDPTSRERFLKWLEEKFHGQMRYMVRSPEKRLDPRVVLKGASSLISVLMNYFSPEEHSDHPETGVISRYAWGRDYHLTMKEKLIALNSFLSTLAPNQSSLGYVDTGPVLDKWWAEKAGLGWIGKNANLINREIGSWVFIGEILTTLIFDEAEYDPPIEPPKPKAIGPANNSSTSHRSTVSSKKNALEERKTFCGTCVRCIQVCPTGAIVAPYVVDARLCISYLTIELRDAIPRELRPLIGNRIFGCDDCQDICPWNRFAIPTSEPDFHPDEENLSPRLVELLSMSREEFHRRFKGSPIQRAQYAGFLRNVAVALGNSHSPTAVPALIRALSHEEPLVRQHAAWALGEIRTEEAQQALQIQLAKEVDPILRDEILFIHGRRTA